MKKKLLFFWLFLIFGTKFAIAADYIADCSIEPAGTICQDYYSDNYCCTAEQGYVCNDRMVAVCGSGTDSGICKPPSTYTSFIPHNSCALGNKCKPGCNPVYSASFSCSGTTLSASWTGSTGTDCNIYYYEGSTAHQISTNCNGSGTATGVAGGIYHLYASPDSSGDTIDGGEVTCPAAACEYSSWSGWSDVACNGGDCAGTNKMRQKATRSVTSGDNCTDTTKYQCVADSACESSPWATLNSSCSGTTPQLDASWGNIGSGTCNIYIRGGSCADYQISTNCSGSKSVTSLGACSVQNGGSYQLIADISSSTKATSSKKANDCTSTSCGGAGQPACCDSNKLTMQADPNPVKNSQTITFSESGSQGSTWVDDTFSGGVKCPGFPITWPASQNCTANAVGKFTWTHYWKTADPGPQCSKTLDYTVDPSCSPKNGGWSGWGTCSNTCGSGTQTRTCTNPSPSCGGAGCSGSSSQSCTNYSGCTYTWKTGSWGGCSISCGGGTRTRDVWCERSNGTTVADSYCSGTKPAASEACNNQPCAPTGLNADCPAPGTTATANWDSVSGATSYDVTLNGIRISRTFRRSLTVNDMEPDSNNLLKVRACNAAAGCGTAAVANFYCDPVVRNAQFISRTCPPSFMVPGQTANVSVTMKNTGNYRWSPTEMYRLGSQNPANNEVWGFRRVDLSSDVAVGSEYTFNFTVTAPNAQGKQSFQWQMLQEDVEWFGDISTECPDIIVSPPCPEGRGACGKPLIGEEPDLSTIGSCSGGGKWRHNGGSYGGYDLWCRNYVNPVRGFCYRCDKSFNPWIQAVGDVHSQLWINASGGP